MSIASCGLADIELSAAKNAKAARKGALGICEKEQATNRPSGKNLGSADDIRGPIDFPVGGDETYIPIPQRQPSLSDYAYTRT
jgi:hypothetical protein